MNVSIRVECKCGGALHTTIAMGTGSESVLVSVNCCEKCLGKSYEEGFVAGYKHVNGIEI